ncbi:hypothetical protein D0T49_04270 [Paludibacter sp. 221]|uniref:hypothetical protein n=1 Tax=Paludibacter sp. 221 TaxID=2302939 RepID=UPI0013D85ADC|nr:hypothetical protein [Paludibacter sp. 221]NDV46255.1 hypothetical protein [Paludibacter sp. 221]
MIDLGDIYNNVITLSKRLNNTDKAVGEYLEANDGTLSQLVRDQLLFGRDANSNEIKPTYRNKEYADFKQSMEPNYHSLIINKNMFASRAYGTPNLFLTGDFQRGIRVDASGKGVLVSSSDEKSSMLLGKYGDILGFTNESIGIFWNNGLSDYLYNYFMNGLQLY